MIQLAGVWLDLIRHHGLTDRDLNLLNRHQSFFDTYADEIVAQFYHTVILNNHLLGLINKHSSIESLMETQSWYLRTLGSNVIDEDYVQGRERIGKVHAAIQLSLPWYLGGTSIYVKLVGDKLSALPIEERVPFYASVTKRLLFDSAIISEQYHTVALSLAEQLANYDSLTKLPNRKFFMERLSDEIHSKNFPFAVLFVDLDSFKEVNDSLGHDMGDFVLTVVAGRLAACVRDIDTVSRLGGDEFIVLVAQVPSVTEVEVVAKRLLESIQQPIEAAKHTIHVTASIGISIYSDTRSSGLDPVKASDLAMYKAKRNGKNRYYMDVAY